MIGGDLGSFTERGGNLCRVGFCIFTPLGNTEFSGVNSDHAILSDAMPFKDPGNATRHLDRTEKLSTRHLVAHG